MWQILSCVVLITTYFVDCCVYYSLLLVIRSAMVNEVLLRVEVEKFVILEVGFFHGGSVG